MKEKYKTYAHAKTRLRYHIVFSTKYRRKCLNEIKDSVLDAFRIVEANSEFKILMMNLEDDHIHFLIKFKPSLSISQVVRRLKQMSTRIIWENNENYLKRFYWKKKQIWTGGYFVSTIGEVSEKNILEYIKNQG